MNLTLYNAILKCDVKVYHDFKDKMTEQLTSSNQNNVLHVIAQHHDCPGCVNAILSDQTSKVVNSLLISKNLMGDTPLCIAARNNHIEMLKIIIEKAQLLDHEQGSSSTTGSHITQEMLRMANNIGNTALHEAVNNQFPKIVKLLVEGDPDFVHLPNNIEKTPLYIALDKRGERSDEELNDILESIMKTCTSPGYGGPAGETVLHAAARSRIGSKWIKQIHEKNPAIINQVDVGGFTPLHHAARDYLFLESAEELLKIDKSMAYVHSADKHDRLTALHLAVQYGELYASSVPIMEIILKHCPDCWDMITSNGQNILHISAEKHNGEIIRFILKQPWAMNLINQPDIHGNTPIHLLLSSMPQYYFRIEELIQHPKVDFDVINMEGITPYGLVRRFRKTSHLTSEQIHIIRDLEKRISWSYRRHIDKNNGPLIKEDDEKKRMRVEVIRRNSERHLLVAALVATVTFAAGFTLPGGYDGNTGANQGKAVLIKKAAFNIFVITNTISVISSYAAIFLHFATTFYKHDEKKLYNRYQYALVLLIFSMLTMVVAFMMGMFTVLDKSLGLAITVCVICSLGIGFLMYLVNKTYQDLRSHNPNCSNFRPLVTEV